MGTQDSNVRPPVASRPLTHDVVVIGASAGAVSALKSLVGALPRDLPAAVLIVVHVSPDFRSELAHILAIEAALPVLTPVDGIPLLPGKVYVSTPDRHMLLEPGYVRIVRGPKENRHRPAIDPLFRSAAWAFGPRVVGIVLTGLLDDGTAGLWAVKSCGGTTVVQDPAEAEYPDMPTNALRHNQIDHCVPLDKIAPLIERLAREPVDPGRAGPTPSSIGTEVEMSTMRSTHHIDDMHKLGTLSPFTCPTCHGALWELEEGDLLRYRCHTGHAFTGQDLIVEQTAGVEEALYSAVRVMEEKAAALRRLGDRWNGRYPKIEADYHQRAQQIDNSIQVLNNLLASDGD